MPRYVSKNKTLNRRNKYWVPKYKYRCALAFCLSYKELMQELKDLTIIRSPNNDGMPRSTDISDSTARNALRVMRIRDKIQLIEDAVMDSVGVVLFPYMLMAITEEGCGWEKMEALGIPIARSRFFEKKHQIIYEVSRRM